MTTEESAILGSILLEPGIWAQVALVVGERHFTSERNRAVWRAIQTLSEQRVSVDMMAVATATRGQVEPAYVMGLVEKVATAANALYYAQLVRDAAARRNLGATGAQMVAMANDPAQPTEAIVEAAQSMLLDAAKEAAVYRAEGIASLLVQVQNDIERVAELGVSPWQPTGFAMLDRLTGGMAPGDLIILGARPSMGKTSLAMQIAEHAARVAPVFVASLEMTAKQLLTRMVSSRSGIPFEVIRDGKLDRGKLEGPEWNLLRKTMRELGELPISISDQAASSAHEIRLNAILAQAKFGRVGLVVVDYVQLVRPRRERENRATEVGDVSHAMKQLAKELNCPVLLLSQLNRDSQKRQDKRPDLHDLRESGDLEQDADQVLMIYRDNLESTKAEILVRKHRNGSVGEVELMFRRECVRFEDA